MNEKYIHTESLHNLRDPKHIIPEIIKIVNPKSVVDIGCGLGTFLYFFKENGVSDVLGIDGPWTNKDMLSKYLNENEFMEKNLEEVFTLDKKYDLAISLEVAEHVSSESADIFVKNLIAAGEIILFSAAIPLQGGQNHINEQWLSYWEEKFSENGYAIHDVIRPLIWNNSEMFWWYRQNMVLVTPNDYVLDENLVKNPLRNIIHPKLFMLKSHSLEIMENGELSPKIYLKLLLKSIRKKLSRWL